MGLIDGIYVFDAEHTPLLHVPLGNAATSSAIPPIVVTNSISSCNGNKNSMLIDDSTILVWCIVDRMFFAVTGQVRPATIDVVSDDEEEDEDEEEDDDDDDTTDSESNESGGENGSLLNDQTELKPKTTKQQDYIVNSVNPLQYISFLQIFIDATKLMLQTSTLSPHKIQISAHRIMMLLQELVDASVTFITDLNQLRELLPNDSIIDKIVSATKQIQNNAASSISNIKNGNLSSIQNINGNNVRNNNAPFKYSTILEKSGNTTPWRKIDIKNIQNEIFLDLHESIDILVTPSTKTTHKKKSRGSFFNSHSNDYFTNNDFYQKAVIHGHINLTTSLAENPTLDIQLNIPSSFDLNNCYPSLHKAIDKSVWKNSNGRSLQLIPPDEKCKLLTYNIDLLELSNESELNISKYIGLINVQLITGLGIHMNEFEITIDTGYSVNSYMSNTESSALKDIKELAIEIVLPNTSNLHFDSNESKDVHTETKSPNDRDNLNVNGNSNGYGSKETSTTENTNLKVLRNSTGTIIRSETGNYEWKFDSDIVVGGKFTLRASVGDENTDTKDAFPQFLRVKYKHYGSVPSGIKVKSMNLINSTGPKPFKGVKYIASSGNYIIR